MLQSVLSRLAKGAALCLATLAMTPAAQAQQAAFDDFRVTATVIPPPTPQNDIFIVGLGDLAIGDLVPSSGAAAEDYFCIKLDTATPNARLVLVLNGANTPRFTSQFPWEGKFAVQREGGEEQMRMVVILQSYTAEAGDESVNNIVPGQPFTMAPSSLQCSGGESSIYQSGAKLIHASVNSFEVFSQFGFSTQPVGGTYSETLTLIARPE